MKLSIIAAALLALTSVFAAAGEMNDAVLREINLARTAPQEYARIVAAQGQPGDRDVAETVRFLEKARPLPALTSSNGLSQGAGLHVSAQGPSGGMGHGFNPFGRMDKFGQRIGMVGENISYGMKSPRAIVCQLIIDKGVSGKGHRRNIFSNSFGAAGVAYGGHARFGAMCVIDFAGAFVESGRNTASL